MALDRVLHGNQPPRSEVERILELYSEGRLQLGEATALLWNKGIPAADGVPMLQRARVREPLERSEPP